MLGRRWGSAGHTWALADNQTDAPCSPGPGRLWEATVTWASSHRGEKNAGVMCPASGLRQQGTLGWTRPAQAQNVAPEWSPAAHWRKSWAECVMTRWIKLGREKRTKGLFIGPTAHKWATAGVSRHTLADSRVGRLLSGTARAYPPHRHILLLIQIFFVQREACYCCCSQIKVVQLKGLHVICHNHHFCISLSIWFGRIVIYSEAHLLCFVTNNHSYDSYDSYVLLETDMKWSILLLSRILDQKFVDL